MFFHLFYAALGIVLMLVVVIGMHELGHAVVARWFGVKISHISIGFGKPIWRWQDKRGIDWVWSLWPLGGYVKLLNTRIDRDLTKADWDECFDKKPIFVRCCILVAGVFTNFIVAGILFSAVFMLGYSVVPPIIQQITPNSTAAAAGLQVGDTIIQIDGHKVNSWQELNMWLIRDVGEPQISLIVKRARQHTTQQLSMGMARAAFNPNARSLLSALGIIPNQLGKGAFFHSGENIGYAIRHGFYQVIIWIYLYSVTLWHIVAGSLPLNLLIGPLGLLWVTAYSMSQGVVVILSLFGLLSVAVGVVNLLPFPGLDGCAMVYCALEKLRKKPISLAVEILLFRVTQIWFLVFLVKLIVNDLLRMFLMYP